MTPCQANNIFFYLIGNLVCHSNPSVQNISRSDNADVVLCLTMYHGMKTYWGSGCIAPRIRKLDTG